MNSCIGKESKAGSTKRRSQIMAPLVLILAGLFFLLNTPPFNPFIGLFLISIGVYLFLVRTPNIVYCMLNRDAGQGGKTRRCV